MLSLTVREHSFAWRKTPSLQPGSRSGCSSSPGAAKAKVDKTRTEKTRRDFMLSTMLKEKVRSGDVRRPDKEWQGPHLKLAFVGHFSLLIIIAGEGNLSWGRLKLMVFQSENFLCVRCKDSPCESMMYLIQVQIYKNMT